jgi:glycosyltransferase involved in cell wall biosynthesis
MIDASGIGAYLKGCLPRFIETGHDFLLIGDRRKLAAFSGKENVRIIHCTVKPFSLKEIFFPPADLINAVNKTELFFSPYFNIPARIRVPVYTTIHDIIFPDMPELCSRAGLAARMWFYRRAVKLSKKIFTVSLFSKSRIEHHLGKTKPVIVAHSGLQDSYPQKSRRRTEGKKYILFIGNIKKHKGLSCLIEAFRDARNAGLDYKLVIVGEKNNFRTSGGEYFFDDDHVLFTGFVSDERLRELLCEAALLVQPSLYEGFGLPPLEALASGTPALVSDIPAFKEIYAGYPVTYFEAGNSAALRDKLFALLGDGIPPRVELDSDLREKYTFSRTTEIILREVL